MRILDFLTGIIGLPLSGLVLGLLQMMGLRFDIEKTLIVGKDARLFWRRRLIFRQGPLTKLVNRLGLAHAPDCVDLLRGHLALVGPRPLAPLEPHAVASYRIAHRPGLISPYSVGAIEFIAGEGEDAVDYVYSTRRTWYGDLQILIRGLRHAFEPGALTVRSAH